MEPYDDSDFIALARARGALAPGVRLPQVQNWKGQLAPALCRAGALDAGQAEKVLQELGQHVQECGGCRARFCALPAARERRVVCPRCGARWPLPGSPNGVPAQAWTGAFAAIDPDGGTVVDRTKKIPLDATKRDTATGGRGSGRGSQLNPSWQRDFRPGGSSGLGPVPGSPQELTAGDTIGPYTILHEISRGAMGVVFKARHNHVEDRLVAIKVMQAQLAEEEDLARFEREGQALARLDHPNVVRVHDLALMDDGRPYLALDFVEGETLSARAGGKPMELVEATGLLEQVARGVAHINAQNIVHRDLKLSNVILAGDGRPVIADFGLVHLQDRHTRLTAAGDILGTPLYLAPEVILRDDEGFDARVDVYALGVMLYKMLLGKYPYYSKLPTELFEKIIEADLELPDTLSEDAKAVLSQALASEAMDRYPSADLMADDLSALGEGRPVQARMLSRDEKVRRWVQRNPKMALGVPALVAVLVLVTLAGMLGLRERAAAEQVEEMKGLVATLRTFSDGLDVTRDERRVHDQLRRHLTRAREALDAGRDLSGDEATAVVADLGAVVEHLQGQRARAQVYSGVHRLPEPLTGAALQAVRRDLDAAPTGGASDVERAFAGQRAWVHLALDDPRGAAEALRDVVASDRPPSPGSGWLEQPAGRRAWRLAWALARQREFGQARELLARAPATLRAELVVFEATLAASPAERRSQLRRVESLARGKDPAATWLRVRAKVESRDEPSKVILLGLLREVRAVADPAHPDALPAALRARARLLEGELLEELGWFESAAHAYHQVRILAPREVVRARVVRSALGPLVLGLEEAAAQGEARARGRLLDGEAAVRAAAVAGERALGRAIPRFTAGLLEADARDTDGDGDGADALVAQLEKLDVVAGGPPLEALAARRAARRGKGVVSPTKAQARQAKLLLAAGEAHLASRSGGLLRGDRSPESVAHHLPLARRAFRLAQGLSSAEADRAACGLAQVALASGDLPEAKTHLARAVAAREEPSWETVLTRGVVAAADGRHQPAAEDVLRAVDLIDELPQRDLARWALQLWALREGDRALEGTPEARVHVRERLSVFAESVPLTPLTRAQAHEDLIATAEALNDGKRAEEAEQRRHAAAKAEQRFVELRKVLLEASNREGVAITDAEARKSCLELLAGNPTNTQAWQNYYIYFGARKLDGFDALQASYEVHAHATTTFAVHNTARTYSRHVKQKWLLDTIRNTYLRLLTTTPKLEGVPYQRDERLRDACGVLLNVVQGADVSDEQILVGIEAAEDYAIEHPRLLSGVFSMASLRLYQGDAAGALALLGRAETLAPPFSRRGWPSGRIILFLFRARALGLLRRFEESAKALKQTLRWLEYTYLITDDPAFRVDRDDPSTMPPAFSEAVVRVKARLENEDMQRAERDQDG